MRVAELISRIVIAHEIMPTHSTLRPEYFSPAHEEEWRFLSEYYATNNSLPNRATFITQFPAFPFEDSENTAQWLVDEVAQDYLGAQQTADLEDLAARIELNPREAARMYGVLQAKYMSYLGDALGERSNLKEKDALAEVERRRALGGLSGITLGFKHLDEVTQGTQRGEIEIWAARPGEGKSWMLLHGAIEALKSGHRVTFVSPEMDEFETQVRYHSLTAHTSSTQMVSGKIDGKTWDAMRDAVYSLKEEAKRWGDLYFREPSNVGRRFNTADIALMIQQDNPSIVIIDGVLLIDPIKQDKDIRKRIINIMEELKQLVVLTGVPMRLAHQINRKQSEMTTLKRTKIVTLDDLLPELHQLAESDSVGQYANRVITLKRIANNILMCIRKNRNNRTGRIVAVEVNIDLGTLTDERAVYGDTDSKSLHGEEDGASERSEPSLVF